MKHFIFLFVLSLISTFSFSQDEVVKTKFIENGRIRKSMAANSQAILPFKRNQKCIVLEYSGQNTYKIKYDETSGYVGDEFLDITEDMMDLFYDFEEREMEKLIAEEEIRKQKIQSIINKKEIGKQDSIAKIEEAKLQKKIELQRVKELKEKMVRDSIAKIENEKKLRTLKRKQDSIAQLAAIKAKALALQQDKEREGLLALVNKRKQDSIADAEVRVRKELERQKEIERKQLEAIKVQRKQDSLKNVKANIVRKLANQKELERKRLEALVAQRKQDSILEFKAAEAKVLALKQAQEQKRIMDLTNKRNQDSIAVVKEAAINELARKQELEAKRKQDSILQLKVAKTKALGRQQALKEKRKQDSINSQKLEVEAKRKVALENALEKQKQEALIVKRKLDSVSKATAREQQLLARKLELARQQLLELKEKGKKDSIARIEAGKMREQNTESNKNKIVSENEEQTKSKITIKEQLKYKDSCYYQINDFDKFYNVTTVRTNEYEVGANFTIELYKQAARKNVFFNLSRSLGCASYLPNKRSSVTITLENGKTVSFYHSWDIDCGDFSLKAKLNTSKISILKSSPIQSISMKGTEGTWEILNVTYKEFFIDRLQCID
ncbi:hypothetical protein ACKGJY_03860 [Hyunsoonleella sp. 2307UL5-6]|uniref:hypothetical protein n=1 Tax=Hyunsoonleella sp. 2307UL5-6 TaxID=3384768 RepID=UPI0039BD3386